jgi:hypothetical protein
VTSTGGAAAGKFELCRAKRVHWLDRLTAIQSPLDDPYRINQLGLKGAIAQLGERLNGIQEVVGSIPTGSTR